MKVYTVISSGGCYEDRYQRIHKAFFLEYSAKAYCDLMNLKLKDLKEQRKKCEKCSQYLYYKKGDDIEALKANLNCDRAKFETYDDNIDCVKAVGYYESDDVNDYYIEVLEVE